MDKRIEISRAAKTLFETIGYKATTVEQVAKLAKVGKGTVYNFFLNKEELLQDVVMAMVKQMIAETERKVNPSLPFTENAHNILHHLLNYRSEHMLYVSLLNEEKSMQTPQVMQILKKVEAEILTYLAKKVDIAIEKGELKQCNSQLVSFLLLKSYLAFIVDWPTLHDEELSKETIASLLEQTIVRGLLV